MSSQENTLHSTEAPPAEGAEPLPAPGRKLWVSLAQSNADLTDQPRRPAKTAETVAAAIVRDMVSRNLGPGDTLPAEAAMLARYRVSRASLREALRLLEVQELIRLKPGPGGGPIVSAVDPRNLAKMTTLYLHLGGATYQELFEALLVMAPISAERAARHSDRTLVRTAMKPFLQDDQPVQGPAYWTVTNEFHGSVEALADNRVIELLGRIVGNIWHEHIVTRMDTSSIREQIHEEHRDIARAIIARQPTKAAHLMRDHFAGLIEEYRQRWPGRFDELIEWE
jgi:GntR family transcriptional regulator, transcriptional repressor for pyruvate dehydrogenase complex